jgi:hypothetical protein
MSTVSSEIFTFWSVPAVLMAIAGGLAYGIVVRALFSSFYLPKRSLFRLLLVGVLWYVPQIVQRAIDPAAPPGSDARTIGTFLLFLTAFTIPAAIVMLWRNPR